MAKINLFLFKLINEKSNKPAKKERYCCLKIIAIPINKKPKIKLKLI